MRHIKLLIIALALLATQPLSAQQQLDTAHELVASSITLPTSDSGTVVVQSCKACPVFRFALNEASYFRINSDRVNLAMLRAEFGRQPDALVLLTLTSDRRNIKQIAISAPTAGR